MDEKKFHIGIKALILNDKNEIIILKTNPEDTKGNGSYWEIPGGRIVEGASEEETLRREVEEEIGVDDIEIIRKSDGFITDTKIAIGNEVFGLVLIVYLCKIKTGKITISPEHTEYKWAPIEEAKKLISVKFPKSFIDKLDELK